MRALTFNGKVTLSSDRYSANWMWGQAWNHERFEWKRVKGGIFWGIKEDNIRILKDLGWDVVPCHVVLGEAPSDVPVVNPQLGCIKQEV